MDLSHKLGSPFLSLSLPQSPDNSKEQKNAKNGSKSSFIVLNYFTFEES